MRIGIKDNICIKDAKVTAGSKMLENYISPYSSTIIEKIGNNADLSKIKMTEFGFCDKDESAEEILKGNIDVAIGSDISGETRLQAAKNKLIGFKPTFGLISRYGLISVASSLEQISVIAKTTEDLAIVLNLIVGYDEKDSGSVNTDKDYSRALNYNINDFKIASIGIELDNLDSKEVELKMLKYVVPVETIIEMAETSSNLARFDGIRYGYRSENCEGIKDVYFNTRAEGFGEETKKRNIFGTYFLSVNSREKYYDKAQKIRKMIKEEILAILQDADIVITPTGKEYTAIANLAGLPAISLASGIQLIGKHFGEEKLISFAYSLERRT